jgi:hypothetical protein
MISSCVPSGARSHDAGGDEHSNETDGNHQIVHFSFSPGEAIGFLTEPECYRSRFPAIALPPKPRSVGAIGA